MADLAVHHSTSATPGVSGTASRAAALRPPYSRAIRYWGIFLALTALVLDQSFVHLAYKSLLIDFLCSGLVVLVLIIGSRTLVLRSRPEQIRLITIPRVSETLPAIPHVLISAASFIFLMLWFSRWFRSEELGLSPKDAPRYLNFLHAGLLLALSSFIMASQKVRSWGEALDLTPGRLILISYTVASLSGTFLLILPISLQPQVPITLTDAFFTAVSAVTVTGLTTVQVPAVFSTFGQLVILLMIQLGGLGIVIVSVGLAVITRERLSLSESLMGRELYDIPDVGKIREFLLRVLYFTLAAEGAGFLWIYFSMPEGVESPAFHALFHTVSAFCNAGFSTLDRNLVIPGSGVLQVGVAALVVIGGIGFPVIFEVLDRFPRQTRYRPWSAHFIMTVWMTGVLIVGGAAAIFLVQWLGEGARAFSWFEMGHAFFYSVSARTAGFNVTEMDHLGMGAQLILTLLMIIGGGPLSTAGGIKVTTTAIIVISSVSLLKGQKWIQFRRGEISPLILQKCVAIIFLYLGVSFLGLTALLITQGGGDPWALTFEVISALSTVGLSLGVTGELQTPSKYILIVLMIVGRLGLLTMVYIGVGALSGQRYRYPQERYYVG